MTKQTAVEWLYQMLRDNSKQVFDGNIWEQAKAMEKDQIVDALVDGRTQYRDKNIVSAEQYYNETYKP
jgi:hypothetical protein